jgi:hypothetical protein
VPEGEHGSALAKVLDALPLTAEARDRLAEEKHLSWGGMDVRTLARTAVGHLERPGNGAVLEGRAAPPASPRQERLADILSTHFGEIDPGTRERLAKAFVNEYMNVHRTDAEVVSAVARQLSLPGAAAAAGVEPLPPDDARLQAHAHEKAAAERQRAESGRSGTTYTPF